MQAVTIAPGQRDSLRLEEVGDAEPAAGQLLVEALAVGICGTDRELVDGVYGESPAGTARLILGHESLGRVLQAPPKCGFLAGDLVVGIVRHPDPVPCANCAVGEWDMCSNGGYTERGIRKAHGFASERWVASPEHVVKVDQALGLAAVLLEPASVLAKAWEHIEAIGRRATWSPRRVLVTGAGPVGLLAGLMGLQRGLEVHVQDHNESGPKPELVRQLGAVYHSSKPTEGFDIVVECTGVPEVISEVLQNDEPNSIVCLAGLSAARSRAMLEVASLNQSMVLNNRVVFGTVNANRRHYLAAADALARAGRGLDKLLTRRVPLQDWRAAYEKRPADVKTVLSFAD